MTTLDTTPRADGFRMPAEWEPHARTWMLWPERPDNWRLGAKPAQAAFVAVAHAIARFEPVTVGVSAAQYENACARLDHPAIRVLELSSDDAWVRDTGPTFVVDARGAVRGVDWTFNAWGGFAGGLYWPWQRDDQLARKILAVEGCARYRTEGFVLEGGAIHVDGEGTLITTEECLLNRNRNPDLDRAAIEAMLAVQIHHAKAGDARTRVDAQHPARRAHAPAASARASSSRAGVPTSSHWPSQHSPLTWPRAMAARSSGASLAGAWAGVSANRAG